MAVIAAIRDSIAAIPGVSVLHTTSDAWHNRSVITFVAPPDIMVDAAVAAIRAARDNIDLTKHVGVHPRIGAADVVPFIPLNDATMEDCIAIARETGERVGAELSIPVYLYERAATHPSRRNLAHVRRGGFEVLRDVIGSDPDRAPDFGPSSVHPTAGAVAIGARPFLIAFNAYIGGSENLPAAQEITRAVRESNGGLPAVKALALEVDGQAQVSMNLVDIDRTPLSVAYATVDREARARGLEITWSEIIGLLPERSAFEVTSRTLRLRDDITDHVLEQLVRTKRTSQSLGEFIATVSDSNPVPGGGSVVAIAAALSAALVSMVAALTLERARFASVHPEMQAVHGVALGLVDELGELAELDAAAYARVADARRMPHATADETAARDAAIGTALLDAIVPPLRVARAAANVAVIAQVVATKGNPNAISDAGVAVLLASAACTGASYNVRINARSLHDQPDADAAVRESIELAALTEAIAADVTKLVNAAL